jgi:hypothetical protein
MEIYDYEGITNEKEFGWRDKVILVTTVLGAARRAWMASKEYRRSEKKTSFKEMALGTTYAAVVGMGEGLLLGVGVPWIAPVMGVAGAVASPFVIYNYVQRHK